MMLSCTPTSSVVLTPLRTGHSGVSRAEKPLEGNRMRKNMQGITLIELMIVIVVLGIIVAVGYPSYRDFAARAKRNEARSALLQIATNQERHFLNNNQYTNDLSLLGLSNTAGTTSIITETGSYRIEIPTATASTFRATATFLLGGNEATLCRLFQIDGAGAKTSLDETDCWTRTR